jgi:hypothetical protein
MSSPILTTIPAPPEEQAIAGVLSLLRAGTLIQSANVKIQAPEGERAMLAKIKGGKKDNAPDDLSELPLIRLSVGGYGTRWENEREHIGKLSLNFDLWAPGSHYGDRFRLWYAFHLAIFPAASNVLDAIIGASPNGTLPQLVSAELTQGSSETVTLGDEDFAQLTKATLALAINIDT